MGMAMVEVNWPSEKVGTQTTSIVLEVVSYGL